MLSTVVLARTVVGLIGAALLLLGLSGGYAMVEEGVLAEKNLCSKSLFLGTILVGLAGTAMTAVAIFK